MNTIIGRKTEQVQRFLENGTRVPVTVIRMPEISIVQLKTVENDGYTAVQLGVGTKAQSKTTKSLAGHIKKSGAKTPLFLREIRVTTDETLPEIGSQLRVEEMLEAGDIVWVTGTSKGKGFAGGVKRYGFRGGPRTHGQSDRERAPGSIGQTTTPGRVYKGKKMAGNMGNEQVTIKNLQVVSVDGKENVVMIAGIVPGLIGGFVTVVKMGTKKNFTALMKNEVEAKIAAEEAAVAEAEAAKVQAEADRIAAEAASNAVEVESTEATSESNSADADVAGTDSVATEAAPAETSSEEAVEAAVNPEEETKEEVK